EVDGVQDPLGGELPRHLPERNQFGVRSSEFGVRGGHCGGSQPSGGSRPPLAAGQNILAPEEGQRRSWRSLRNRARKKSSTRMAMKEWTNASVAARPTPSAPAPAAKPRW